MPFKSPLFLLRTLWLFEITHLVANYNIFFTQYASYIIVPQRELEFNTKSDLINLLTFAN